MLLQPPIELQRLRILQLLYISSAISSNYTKTARNGFSLCISYKLCDLEFTTDNYWYSGKFMKV